jgi:iron complex transport system substrate-binding protein
VRICSLLPSATEIIAELGLIDSLVGVSEECRWPPEVVGKPIVTAARQDLSALSSIEIDQAVRASLGKGQSLYAVDADLIAELEPDLIITQDLCAVCAVSSGDLATACPVAADVVSLDPRTLGEVADTVHQLAGRLGAVERSATIVHAMQQKLDAVRGAVYGHPQRRVFVAEWIEPPFTAGHWLPEMVQIAGGRDVLGTAGQPSHETTWDTVIAADPELVVVAACGFSAAEAADRAAGLRLPFQTVVVDGDSYYSRPAPRVADGVRQLGHLLHPPAVPDPGLPAIELVSGSEWGQPVAPPLPGHVRGRARARAARAGLD